MSCSIGEFHMVYNEPMLNKYKYHRMLTCLLDKHKCKELRRKYFIADINYAMTEHVYYEALKA